MPSRADSIDTFIKVAVAIVVVAIIAGLSILGTAGSTAFESMIDVFYDLLPVVGIGITMAIVYAAMRMSGKL